MSYEEAVKQAMELLEPFCPPHPRVKPWVGFEVEPATFSECPHVKEPEEALEEAYLEDKYAIWEEEERTGKENDEKG